MSLTVSIFNQINKENDGHEEIFLVGYGDEGIRLLKNGIKMPLKEIAKIFY